MNFILLEMQKQNEYFIVFYFSFSGNPDLPGFPCGDHLPSCTDYSDSGVKQVQYKVQEHSILPLVKRCLFSAPGLCIPHGYQQTCA